jgi:hypothetical protein
MLHKDYDPESSVETKKSLAVGLKELDASGKVTLTLTLSYNPMTWSSDPRSWGNGWSRDDGVGSNFFHALSKESLWVCLCVHLLLLANNSVKTFPRQRRIVRGVVFHAVHVVSKKSRRLFLPRTSCYWRNIFPWVRVLPRLMSVLMNPETALVSPAWLRSPSFSSFCR